MKRVVSGIKPTGEIHLGNYIGMMKPMLDLQHAHECFFFIADLHALNQVQDGKQLSSSILDVAASYMAAGLDLTKATLFRQSDILQDQQLAVILSTLTGLGLLDRAHAVKDAKGKAAEVNAGTYYYPVLMAADILLYQGEVVPVGQDQLQHLEIARDLAEKFNRVYGQCFALPQAQINAGFEKLPGLDGQKMSKSYGNVVGLFDSFEAIQAGVARVQTDSKTPDEPKDTSSVIYQIYSAVGTPEQTKSFGDRFLPGGMSYRDAKQELAEMLEGFIAPLRTRKAELLQNPDHIRAILADGATKVRPIAETTLKQVQELTGLA